MRIAYYRVSTSDQSVEAQRSALGGNFDKEFEDVGISGSTMAADRPAFARLLEQVRSGDTVHVYAIDRLGRDALDVQATVRRLLEEGVAVDVHGIGQMGRGVGEIVLAVLAQVADLERQRIRERTGSGRNAARKALEATGRTHRGKASLGRPKAREAATVDAWRAQNKASAAETARHFGLSIASVKRYRQEVKLSDRPDPLAAVVAPPKPVPENREISAFERSKMERRQRELAEQEFTQRREAGWDPLADFE